MSDVNDNDEVFPGFELASCRGCVGSSIARRADSGGCEGNSELTSHSFFFRRVHRACRPPTLMPRPDERRRGVPCDQAPSSLARCADRCLARKRTVQEIDDRAPFHCSVPSPASEQKKQHVGSFACCCALSGNGHATAAPLTSVMNSRCLMQPSPRAQHHSAAQNIAHRGIAAWSVACLLRVISGNVQNVQMISGAPR